MGLKTAGIFFDFSNAFNTIRTNDLISFLRNKQYPGDVISYIHNFLLNRKTILQTDNGNISHNVCNGIPQGDVLSPHLFNLDTIKFHELNQINVVDIVQYADDFVVIVSSKTNENLQKLMQTTTDKFKQIAETLNLQVNIEKTKIVFFNRSKYSLRVEINQQIIENVRHHYYLGVILDKNLTFAMQVQTVKKKVKDRIDACYDQSVALKKDHTQKHY